MRRECAQVPHVLVQPPGRPHLGVCQPRHAQHVVGQRPVSLPHLLLHEPRPFSERQVRRHDGSRDVHAADLGSAVDALPARQRAGRVRQRLELPAPLRELRGRGHGGRVEAGHHAVRCLRVQPLRHRARHHERDRRRGALCGAVRAARRAVPLRPERRCARALPPRSLRAHHVSEHL